MIFLQYNIYLFIKIRNTLRDGSNQFFNIVILKHQNYFFVGKIASKIELVKKFLGILSKFSFYNLLILIRK